MTAERGAAGGLGAHVAARRRVLEERRQELSGLERLDQELRAHLARLDGHVDPGTSRESILAAGAAERRHRLLASLDKVEQRRREVREQIDGILAELAIYEQRIRIERRDGRFRRKRTRERRRGTG